MAGLYKLLPEPGEETSSAGASAGAGAGGGDDGGGGDSRDPHSVFWRGVVRGLKMLNNDLDMKR